MKISKMDSFFLDKCEKNASFSQCHHYFICDKSNINFNDDE